MISVVAVDISRIINMAMGLFMHITPVIYSDKVESQLALTIVNNPAHRAGHQHQDPEEGAIHPRAQHGVFWQNSIKWNPLTYLVCSARDIIIYGKLYNAPGYFICAGLSFLLFMISWRLFYVSEDRIIERMI